MPWAERNVDQLRKKELFVRTMSASSASAFTPKLSTYCITFPSNTADTWLPKEMPLPDELEPSCGLLRLNTNKIVLFRIWA